MLLLSAEQQTAAARSATVRRWFKICAALAVLALALGALTWQSKRELAAAVKADRNAAGKLEFAPLDPVYDRILAEAINSDMFVRPEEAGVQKPPTSALQALEARGVQTNQPISRYKSSIDLLQYLFLIKDYGNDYKAIKALSTLVPSDLPDKPLVSIQQGADDLSSDDDDEGRFSRGRVLPLYRLLWYLEHYYSRPIPALLKTEQVGRAGVMATLAANRLKLYRASVGTHFDQDTRHQINGILLTEVLLKDPSITVGKSAEVEALLQIVLQEFPKERELELRAREVSAPLKPFKMYWLAVYDFKRADYVKAKEQFESVTVDDASSRSLKNLTRLMAIRSEFWSMRAQTLRTHRLATAERLAAFRTKCKNEANAVTDDSYLRKNILEYAELADRDLRDHELFRDLDAKVKAKEAPQGESSTKVESFK